MNDENAVETASASQVQGVFGEERGRFYEALCMWHRSMIFYGVAYFDQSYDDPNVKEDRLTMFNMVTVAHETIFSAFIQSLALPSAISPIEKVRYAATFRRSLAEKDPDRRSVSATRYRVLANYLDDVVLDLEARISGKKNETDPLPLP